MSAIAVFLKTENPACNAPRHSASKMLAALVVASPFTAKWADALNTKLQILTNETWKQVKQRVRPSPSAKRAVPRLLPPSRPLNLDLSYPEAGRESSRHPHYALRYNL